jgi:gamma-glutamyl-gamma-aminobutyrate hydrolase PuuD
LKIGLTQGIIDIDGIRYDRTEHGWYSYLKEHHISTIKNDVSQDFTKIASELDCLIVTGGSNSLLRTDVETKLIEQMIQFDKTIIGICQGAFLLTKLFGGSWINDKLITTTNRYRHMGNNHMVMYKNEEKTVNSYHNLCIDKPPKTATVLAVDIDGYCESWITGKIAAVVWHPERMEVPWVPEEIENLLKRKI